MNSNPEAVEEQSINRAFSPWKIWTAVILGLIVAGFMLYQSLAETHFIKVNDQSGTHFWKDANGNGKVDLNLLEEFKAGNSGAYRQKSASELLTEMQWTGQSFFWLAMAILFMFGRDLAYMWRIRILTKNHLGWRQSFRVIMLWEFASALSPGVVGGSAVAMFILNREKISLGRSTAIVVITAMMDNLFYVLMIPLVFCFISPAQLFPQHNVVNQSVEFVFWMGFFIILSVCALLFASIFFYPGLVKRFLSFIFRLPFLKRWRTAALQTGDEVVLASETFRQERAQFWVKSFGATLISWISRYLVINCLLAGFLSLGLFEHFFILGKQLVLWLFMLISPTPGASGIAEYAFGELMADFSSSAFLLAALAVIWRLISYFPYLIIGAFILPRWLGSKRS